MRIVEGPQPWNHAGCRGGDPSGRPDQVGVNARRAPQDDSVLLCLGNVHNCIS
jgi:hypothetical protein